MVRCRFSPWTTALASTSARISSSWRCSLWEVKERCNDSYDSIYWYFCIILSSGFCILNRSILRDLFSLNRDEGVGEHPPTFDSDMIPKVTEKTSFPETLQSIGLGRIRGSLCEIDDKCCREIAEWLSSIVTKTTSWENAWDGGGGGRYISAAPAGRVWVRILNNF